MQRNSIEEELQELRQLYAQAATEIEERDNYIDELNVAFNNLSEEVRKEKLKNQI